jgi:putative DNA primase/helicase
MHTNHKPVVRGTDEGIWRRLRFVPFDVVIPEDERDGKLPDQLALGVDGILAWLVDGYRQWQDRGLAEPEQVRTATDAFRGESDMLGLFLAERCMTSPMDTSDRRSCSPRGRRGASARTPTPALTPAFSRDLINRGFDKRHTDVGNVWQGIGLYADEADE